MTTEERPRLKWARSQRFRLTAKGQEAQDIWKAKLAEVRSQGKALFDAAQAEWGKTFGLRADDAAYLAELSGAPLRVEDIEKNFTDLGASRQDVKDALGRLYDAGLAEPAPQ